MKIKFRAVHLSRVNLERLIQINTIIERYQRQGYRLTLRQLYYQLVSSDIIENKPSEYGKLSTLLKEGRMGGMVDWDAIEDRLRRPDKPAAWENPAQIIESCIRQYRCNRMEGQNVYLEVWVEKDALSGVLKRVTEQYGVPIVVNRGYSSVTAMFDAHERFENAHERRQIIKVIYIGDFDPSGKDMVRDITDRIQEFNEKDEDDDTVYPYNFEIIPIALTWEQIQQYNPPTNPAKITDPRAKAYIKEFGEYSWEVDALRPEVLNRILTEEIESHINLDIYDEVLLKEKEDKNKLKKLKEAL